MRNNWRDKVRSWLFIEEIIEETDDADRRETSQKNKRQDVETKMYYQYPEKTSGRFPNIDDHQDIKKDVPAYKRREEVNERHSIQSDPQPKEEPIEKPIVKEDRKPFKPSRVPSPIYGYQKREEIKKVENIPTFVRKQTAVDDEQQIERPIVEEKPAKVSTESRPPAEPIAPETKQAAVKQEEPKEPIAAEMKQAAVKQEEPKEPITITREKETEKADVIDPQERIEAKEKQTKRIHSKQRSKQPPKKRSDVGQGKQAPFNVMMTPRDKHRLNEKKRKQSAIKHEKEENKQAPLAETTENRSVPYHLLNDPEQATNADKLWVQNQQELLENTLKHFNVGAKVVNATQGPSVTRFEVQPEMGVKVSRVRNLSDDIKLNMSAKDIRIEAPIPGKNTIGIEIPNLNAQTVGLQEIFATNEFMNSQSPLTIGLGLNVEGQALITNIAKMPHGLIAGATGSGKSVCINTILISLLYKASHDEVKFLLIDPKMVELAPYNGIPHLVAPVITDVKAATAALKWAVIEMEERYEKFVLEGVRDINRYNDKMLKQGRIEEKIPFIVIVIDELADLMMASPQDVEDAISRIAQKARACGMHLLLATQRPSVDVITGLIKANIPTRIAFSVSSQVDSRTIIDSNGAEKLLGKGDMLFIENGSGKSLRLQGAFVSDEEIERITNYARTIAEPTYLFEQEQLLLEIEADEEVDELFEEVTQFVLEHNSASTSLLQRQFRIGYNRAARLMDTLESKGVITGQNGSKPRDVLLSKSQLEELQS